MSLCLRKYMKITIAAVCASVMLLSTCVTVFADVSFSFGGKALPENVSGKNLTAGSGYLWDEKEDYEGNGTGMFYTGG